MARANPPSFETISETAERLNVSTKTVRRYIARGQLTGYRLGSTLIRLNPAEVDSFLRPMPSAKSA